MFLIASLVAEGDAKIETCIVVISPLLVNENADKMERGFKTIDFTFLYARKNRKDFVWKNPGRYKGMFEEHLPIVVHQLKQLRSGDFEVHTKKVEYVEILQAATHWVAAFGAKRKDTNQHIWCTCIVHSIRPKSLDRGNSRSCKLGI